MLPWRLGTVCPSEYLEGFRLPWVKKKVLVTQLGPTLCDSMVCGPQGSSVHGILQARILELVAIPFSRGSSWPRDWTQASCIAGRYLEQGASFSRCWNDSVCNSGAEVADLRVLMITFLPLRFCLLLLIFTQECLLYSCVRLCVCVPVCVHLEDVLMETLVLIQSLIAEELNENLTL